MSKGMLTLLAVVGAMMAATTVQAGAPALPLGDATMPHDVAVETQIQPTAMLRSATPAQLLGAIVTGADYLKEMAADITDDNANNGIDGVSESPDDPDDGGWDWRVTTPPAPVHHTTAASPPNIYGATAQGLYRAYFVTGDPTYLTAMTDAANGMIGNPNVRSASDIVFLQNYQDLPSVGGTTYADAAKAKYDGRIAVYGSADSLAKYIRDVRNSQGYGNGIIAWDIGLWALAAAMLDDRYGGYASDAVDFAEVIYQDSYQGNPGYFDLVADQGYDPGYAVADYWWYNLGVSGLMTAFSASGAHADSLPGLATLLLQSQCANGAISYQYGGVAGDEDWQSTAYGAMALADLDITGYATEIGDMGAWIVSTQDVGTTGGWRYSSNNHYPEEAGENVAALYWAYVAANSITPVGPGTCISIDNDCVTVDVDIARTDTANMRAFSVDLTLTGIVPCLGTASFHEGTYLNAIGGTAFQVVDHGGGSYTVDCAILGVPCGQTAATGTLFDIDVKTAGSDGTGTVAITDVIIRDCSNVNLPGIPGADLDLTIDTVAPVAVGDLAATQQKTGNDGDGTTVIQLAYTTPVDADSVMVFRKGYGNYPEYDDPPGAGSVPTPPTDPADAIANGWAFVPNAVLPNDETTVRDFYYYVMFASDECGNVSAVSNRTDGTLNYHLGDVSDGSTPGQGDNLVAGVDVSLLGANYGIFIGPGDPVNYLDVGPTADYYVNTLPSTDNEIGFEDLMMFAINYGIVSKSAPQLVRDEGIVEDPTLVLTLDATGPAGRLTGRLVLEDNGRLVKGVHSALSFDRNRLRLVDVRQGELLDSQSSFVFFKPLDTESGAIVDAAIFGQGQTLEGSGEVAVLTFEVVSQGAFPTLTEAVLRDRNNQPAVRRAVESGPGGGSTLASGTELPSRLELVGARPNPFDASTQIVFRLPQATEVQLRVYDVKGRLVRTLVNGTAAAGEVTATWDGRTNDGRLAGAGIYFYTFQAGDMRETRKLLRLR